MVPQQEAAIKDYSFVGSKLGVTAGRDVAIRLKRRVDPRCEDFATQVEAERRDLASVVVLGYN